MCTLIILTICSILGLSNLFTKDPKWRINAILLGLCVLTWVFYFAVFRGNTTVRHIIEVGSGCLLIAGVSRVYHLRVKHGVQLPLENFIMRLGSALWAVIKHPLMFALTVIVAVLFNLRVLASFQLISLSISWIWVAAALVPFLALAGIRIPNFITAWKNWKKNVCPFGYTASETIAVLQAQQSSTVVAPARVGASDSCDGQCADCARSGECPGARSIAVGVDGALQEQPA